MARIRGKNTKPELRLRGLLHSEGLRYRLHRSDLPGKPDIVFPGRRVAVFVDGCFWHRHEGCHLTTTPSTRPEFWRRKFAENQERDARQRLLLREMGWRVAVFWECAIRDASASQWIERFRDWLEGGDDFFETGLIRKRGTPADQNEISADPMY